MAGTTPTDLATLWREAMRDWESHTNTTLNRLSGSESFSASMNQMLAGMVKAQAAYGEAVEQALIKLNLPNRADMRALAAKLDDLEHKLDALAERLDRPAQPGPPEPSAAFPPRTRRAPRPQGEGG